MKSRKILLVGQAPSRSAGKVRAFDGPSGRRLAKLVGIEFEDFFNVFDTVNLLVRWPGKHGGRYQYRDKGDRFSIARARRSAKRLQKRFCDYRVVVLCGSRVSRAFGLKDHAFGFGHPLVGWRANSETSFARLGTSIATIPHPSGCNLIYHHASVRKKVARFMWNAFKVAWCT